MAPSTGFGNVCTLVSIEIKVGENHRGMFLYELLNEFNLRKFGSLNPQYFETTKINGRETNSLFERISEGDQIELKIKIKN